MARRKYKIYSVKKGLDILRKANIIECLGFIKETLEQNI